MAFARTDFLDRKQVSLDYGEELHPFSFKNLVELLSEHSRRARSGGRSTADGGASSQ